MEYKYQSYRLMLMVQFPVLFYKPTPLVIIKRMPKVRYHPDIRDMIDMIS